MIKLSELNYITGILDKKDCEELVKETSEFKGVLFEANVCVDYKIENKLFTGCDFEEISFVRTNFNKCKFKKCVFMCTDFLDTWFLDCEFEECYFKYCCAGKSQITNTLFKRSSFDCFSLTFTNLSRVTFEECDLTYSSFRTCACEEMSYLNSKLPDFQLPGGDLIVYKRLVNSIAQLTVKADTPRTATLVGRKCRAASAKVNWIENVSTGDFMSQDYSLIRNFSYGNNVTYVAGEEAIPDKYDDNPFIECSHGIHFFLTEKEAREFY